jgi:hypothetical protein
MPVIISAKSRQKACSISRAGAAAGMDSVARDINETMCDLGKTVDEVVGKAEPPTGKALAAVTGQATLAWQFDRLPNQGHIDGEPCDCLVPGTLVYTKNGMRPINRFRENLSAFTHEGRHQRVTQTMSRHYSGQLVSVTPYYIDYPLLLTPNHPVFAVKDGALARGQRSRFTTGQGLENHLAWVPATDLGSRDLMCFPRLAYSQDVEIVSHDLAELFGWYVAEGCKDKVGNRIIFALGKHETENIRHIQEIIKRQFGVEPRTYNRATSVHVTFSHRDFSPMFAHFGNGARDKTVPVWLLHLPWDKQYAFLRGLISGDGSIDSHNISIATSSQKLAAQLRLLLFRLGLLHNLSKRVLPDARIGERLIKATGPLYCIRVAGAAAVDLAKNTHLSYRPPSAPPLNYGRVEEGYALIPMRQLGLEDYEGRVYNMEVALDNTYVTLHGAIHNSSCLGELAARK